MLFCYLNHRTCDSENGIITDFFVTPGNVNYSAPHTELLEYKIDKFGLGTEALCADGEYDNCEVYDEELYISLCPVGRTLCYSGYSKPKGYISYFAKCADFKNCPL